jgi:kanamycin kinase
VPQVAPPTVLAEVAPGWDATLAYQLIPQVSTWRLTNRDGEARFAKVARGTTYPSLDAEAERMVWAAPYLPVPTVVSLHRFEDTTVLVTAGLPGRDGTDPELQADLPALVAAFGRGLAAFHRAVGEEWCPFRFDMAGALHHVQHRVATDDIDPSGFHPEHRHLTSTQAMDLLERTAPASEDLVVCHGDYCPPNVLLSAGRVTGYLDLGELGVADRWWDIAVGSWSVGWNFGVDLEQHFYDSYGITPEPDRIAFFRLLYDLVS